MTFATGWRGGTKRMAELLDVPIVGEIPMFTQLRVNGDAGKPHANFEAGGRLREALEDMVGRIAGEVSKRVADTGGQLGPTLEIS